MNKGDYLSELHKYLADMPEAERDSAMRFYMEYFDDAGEENEQSVMIQLGTPRQLADQLLGESTPSRAAERTAEVVQKIRTTKKSPLTWVAIVLGSPIWLPLAGAGLGLLIAALAVMFSLMLVLLILAALPPVLSASLMLGGAYLIINGFAVLWQHFPTTMVLVGAGIAMGALGALTLQPSLGLMRALSRKLFMVTGWITTKLRRPRFSAMKGGN